MVEIDFGIFERISHVMTSAPDTVPSWSPVRKIAFRFMVIYCGLHIFYTLLRFRTIPGLTQLHKYIWPVWRRVVGFANDSILHISETLVDPNSSTDTSFSWASQFTILLIAVIAAAGWTIADRRRSQYNVEEYWLRIAIRYFIAYFALYYGIIKLFGLQMPFPSLSQLSTTLGDLSPTRLAWMFIGSSTSYQVFSGIIETAAGLFLLYRRTTTLGLVLSLAVFSNIVALNFSFDISAKLMSINFLVMITYLLLFESQRLIDFFLNKPTTPTESYSVEFSGRSKYGRIAAKAAFIYVSIFLTIMLSIRTYKSYHLTVDTRPVTQGIYEVEHFSLNGDSLLRNRDSLRWHDLALYGVLGSIKTSDTIFVQRYKRGYFSFEVDSVAQQLKLKRDYDDTTYIMKLNYEIPDEKTLRLTGMLRTDTLQVILKRSNKKFRLAEEKGSFQWIQEVTQ